MKAIRTTVHTASFVTLTALLCLAGACDDPIDAPGPTEQPPGWQDEVALATVDDVNPAPDIIEFDLTASVENLELTPGTTTPAWTYNGTLPGPLIRGKVGDRLIVHFTNNLPEPTTVHWHGLRLPNAMDGVPHITQPPIEPGGSFTYDFILRDAGAYWYHPHVNSAAQVGYGLYGAVIVDDPNEPEFGDELILVLSDIGLTDSGALLPPDTGGEFGDLFGREGNVILVNGRVNPLITVQPGLRQRWRVLNMARSRYYTIGFDGQTFTRIGNDGGLADAPVEVEMPVLIPGERADLIITPTGRRGSVTQVQWIPTERGYGSLFNRVPEDLFRIEFADEAASINDELPTVERDIDPIDTTGATEVDVEFTIDDEGPDGLEMGINHVPYAEVVPFEARIGETQVWKLINDTDFAHPFHLHGYFFQVIDDNGVPVLPLAWRDTIDVPVGHTIRIAIDFDERPGTWMFHCHILDHAALGMMAVVNVTE